jgi:hypothetical protein
MDSSFSWKANIVRPVTVIEVTYFWSRKSTALWPLSVLKPAPIARRPCATIQGSAGVVAYAAMIAFASVEARA